MEYCIQGAVGEVATCFPGAELREAAKWHGGKRENREQAIFYFFFFPSPTQMELLRDLHAPKNGKIDGWDTIQRSGAARQMDGSTIPSTRSVSLSLSLSLSLPHSASLCSRGADAGR